MKPILEIATLLTLGLIPVCSLAEDPNTTNTTANPPATGTRASEQSTKTSDVELTRKIRQELMNRNLSTAAKNLTIVTRDGYVTLSGQLASATERDTVLTIARTFAGTEKVKNNIAVRQ